MLDVRTLRTDLDGVTAALARRGDESLDADVVKAAAMDAEMRRLAAERDQLRGRVNTLSKEVGALFREGRRDEAEGLQAESRSLGDREKELDAQADAVAAELRSLLLVIPNVPHPEAPDGAGDADNPVLQCGGTDPAGYGAAQRVPHWDIGADLGILDTERATKLSGAMFSLLRGAGATLSRALTQYGLDRNADAFVEIRPPSLVTSETLTATGQLPKFADDAYHLERDDLWAIPTGEVPLTSMHRDEVLAESDLPLRYMTATPCYRREAGSAGRDTRGMLRSHEFDKVEILAFSTPEQAPAMFEELLNRALDGIRDLGLSWRTVDICVGDLGQSHHRSIDIEVYAPGADAWLEVSSVSWFSDYQARRANIRYKGDGGGGTHLVHTLNGSALAVPRVWAAILESNRNDDGTVNVPEPLRPYMRGITRLG
ncbi:serine--tRNA ligase [Candidatus Neomicrothrix sp.]|uniref:serine--tRNA ligase n=1 Tax=Candidatus Neomicrothrix sp. TaxID=2719034 RepID=UPI001B41D7D1|nr:serine--tRNA ligase [Candidatus Microthrix sp.]MBP7852059.1 serine--tRNA ligase [Candidatus Microthrix sp.]MBP7877416.1 serine--tRNA ligase [Candidatus Microthrix sp.]MBP9620438.1 serine--tRNA ligase [Candidatus Microthrix sp.]MBP9832706.1 serine--tRNA ligase [Candidatus Microthrix sp.]